MQLHVRTVRKQHRMRLKALASIIGMPKSTLSMKERQLRPFSLKELERIATALHAPCLCTLIELDGLQPPCPCQTESSTSEARPTLLVVCQCGSIILACKDPTCTRPHHTLTIQACQVCTATGGLTVAIDSELILQDEEPLVCVDKPALSPIAANASVSQQQPA